MIQWSESEEGKRFARLWTVLHEFLRRQYTAKKLISVSIRQQLFFIYEKADCNNMVRQTDRQKQSCSSWVDLPSRENEEEERHLFNFSLLLLLFFGEWLNRWWNAVAGEICSVILSSLWRQLFLELEMWNRVSKSALSLSQKSFWQSDRRAAAAAKVEAKSFLLLHSLSLSLTLNSSRRDKWKQLLLKNRALGS